MMMLKGMMMMVMVQKRNRVHSIYVNSSIYHSSKSIEFRDVIAM